MSDSDSSEESSSEGTLCCECYEKNHIGGIDTGNQSICEICIDYLKLEQCKECWRHEEKEVLKKGLCKECSNEKN